MLKKIPAVPNEFLQNKLAARNAVKAAIKRGDLQSISECHCAVCGVEAHAYHHHSYHEFDYLDVTPLCGACHKTLHNVGPGKFIQARMEHLEQSQAKAVKEARRSVGPYRTMHIRWMVVVEQQLQFLRDLKASTEWTF